MSIHASLDVMEAIKEAWAKQSGAKATFWAVLIIVIILRIAVKGLDEVVDQNIVSNSALELLIGLGVLAITILDMVLNWGLIYLGIKRALSQPIEFGDIKHVFRWIIFFKMLGLFILQFLILLPSIVLLLAPLYIPSLMDPDSALTLITTTLLAVLGGILFLFLMLRMTLAAGLVLFGEKGPWMAIRISFRTTKGNVFALLGLTILNFFIILVSMIPLGIGLIWSIPYALINYGVVYKKLFDDIKAHH